MIARRQIWTESMSELAVEMLGITKRFQDVFANYQVNFNVNQGEIHALVGENGAGKTTLMNILFGIHRADEGLIKINGSTATIRHPKDAIRLGIGMVHQQFLLFPSLTVAENIVMGREPVKHFFWIDSKFAKKSIENSALQFGMDIDPDKKVEDLPIGVQQRVEILRALYRNAEIMILDEPTSILAPQEIEGFFEVVRSLSKGGKTIIFISHKLREVFAIADRITVLRQGRLMGVLDAKETNEAELTRLMIGKEVARMDHRSEIQPGESLLKVEKLTLEDNRGRKIIKDISFTIRRGEIYGIAGIQGNGQLELVETLMGLRKPQSGKISYKGRDLAGISTREFRQKGFAYIPDDRFQKGLAVNMSLAENLILGKHSSKPFTDGWRLFTSQISSFAENAIKEFQIIASSKWQNVHFLSGGNQQKVVLARELAGLHEVLIAVEPTRGLDIRAAEQVHTKLIAEKEQGTSILLVSSDLDELLRLSDRIAVIFEGTIVGEFKAESVDKMTLGKLMIGAAE